jgi:hypothetical protein
MNAIAIASITFVCTFGSAWLGTVIRSMLPQSHLSRESQDVVRLGMGLVATMTALLLGLVTAAAKGTFDSQDLAIRNSAVNILTLDRHLARYGPETEAIRDLVRRAVAARIEAMWPTKDVSPPPSNVIQTSSPAEEGQNMVLALSPGNDMQRWHKSEALSLTDELVRARWRVVVSGGGAVPRAFLVVVIFWLTATFASFGLYAPRNGTVLSVFFLSSLSVAAAVFLILELDGPSGGLIRVASDPMRLVLAHIGK